MPLYNYRCTCGIEIRIVCAISDRPAKVDCECGEKAPFVFGKTGLVVGKETFYKSDRTKMKDRLQKREDRLEKMPKEQAQDFRRISKIVTGGEF